MKTQVVRSEIDLEEIISHLKQKKTWKEIETLYGYNRGILRRYCKDRGITRSTIVSQMPKQRKESDYKPPTVDMLKKDVEEGLTLREVAEKYKVTYQGAYFWFKQHGIKFNKATIDPPPLIETIDMIDRFTLQEVAAYYNVSVSVVNGWRRHYGMMKQPTPKRKSGIPENVRDYALKMYFLGMWDESDIAEEYGIDTHSVNADIELYGMTDDMVQLMPSRLEFMKDAERMNTEELASYYGTTQPQILKWFKALSVKKKEGALQ